MKLSLCLLIGCLLSSVVNAQEIPADQPIPTQADIHYGSHQRHVLDFFKAESDKPTPVLVFIHGGGWLHGSKEQEAHIYRNNLIPMLKKNGISTAFINYRFTTEAILPAPVFDAARAIQFLRYKADELNIDKTRIAATGGSAGGCTILWLATHDDLADPNATDPVLRESTRLCGALVGVAQTTIEPAMIRAWIGERGISHMMIRQAGGFKSNKEMDANYATKAELYREFSPVTHLTQDDPPMLLRYHQRLDDQKEGIHHALFGFHFMNHAQEVGATCYLELRQHPDIFPGSPSINDFLLNVLIDRPLPKAK